MPDRCNCHRAKCIKCGKCSCTCPPPKRLKRSNHSVERTSYYEESGSEEVTLFSLPSGGRRRSGGTTLGRAYGRAAVTPRSAGTTSGAISRSATSSARSSAASTPSPSLSSPRTILKELKTIKCIHKALNLDKNEGRGMPSAKDRSEKLIWQNSTESTARLLQFTLAAIQRLCTIICPKDPESLALLSLCSLESAR